MKTTIAIVLLLATTAWACDDDAWIEDMTDTIAPDDDGLVWDIDITWPPDKPTVVTIDWSYIDSLWQSCLVVDTVGRAVFMCGMAAHNVPVIDTTYDTDRFSAILDSLRHPDTTGAPR